MRSTCLWILLAALAPALGTQAPLQTSSKANFRVGANSDSGVYLSARRDSLLVAAWFVPEHVLEWCDSMSAALARPITVPSAGAWTPLGASIWASHGNAGIDVLVSAHDGAATYRVEFDGGDVSAAIVSDASHFDLSQLLSSMRNGAQLAMSHTLSGPAETFYVYVVTRPVMAKNGNPAPSWPPRLQGTVKWGTVMVQFIVDTTGEARMSSFKVISASNMYFAEEVKRVLPRYKFYPAEADGHLVAQYVQVPFVFKAAH